MMAWKDDHAIACGGKEHPPGPSNGVQCWEYWPCDNEWRKVKKMSHFYVILIHLPHSRAQLYLTCLLQD